VIQLAKVERGRETDSKDYLILCLLLFEPFFLAKLGAFVPSRRVLLQRFDNFIGTASNRLHSFNLGLVHLLSRVTHKPDFSVVFAFSYVFFVDCELFQEGFSKNGAWVSHDCELAGVAVHNLEAGFVGLPDDLIEVDGALVHVEDFGRGALDGLEAGEILDDEVVALLN
jgi:hypothetical protein